jgi:hypothetical protein
MVIITGFFKDETYGLLGPQMAATIIQDRTPYECIVIAVTREYDKAVLKKHLGDYFGIASSLVGFSALSGREDLFVLAKELRDEGAVTILAGPQANVDFAGEEGWQNHPHRFKGLSENFNFGFESFDDVILKNLNKGLSVKINIDAIRLIRQLKEEFPHQLGYSSQEGANHGFIHPTPWDTREASVRNQKTISLYGLQNDILPPHSTPLIIHHASGLGALDQRN